MTFSVISTALAAAVATAGTFTASYPSGKDAGSFFLAMGHKLTVNGDEYYFPVDFDVTLGTSSITITNKGTPTWPAGATIRLQMEELGERTQLDVPLQSPNARTGVIGSSAFNINSRAALVPSTVDTYLQVMTLGAPIALDDDGICASQSLATSGAMTMNGALVNSSTLVATLDQPRAVQVVSGGADTAVITVTGTDVYGFAMSENLTLNGTTAVPGKKAFKTVTGVRCGAAIANGVKVGTTDILGLPMFLPDAGFVVAELQNGKKIADAGEVQVPFSMNDAELATPINKQITSPVNGFISRIQAIVDRTIVTGGDITVNVGATPVTGLLIAFANGALPGVVASDTPTTAFSSTTAVTTGSQIQVVAGSTFATSGAINGFVGIVGTAGTIVAGIRTAGGSTTTTGDVRGTYKPPIACDGTTVWQLVAAIPDRYPGISQNLS